MSVQSVEILQMIRDETQALGKSMEQALPFKRSRLLGWLPGIYTSSPIALTPVDGNSRTYTRAWLERPIAKSAERSPITMRVDEVTVRPELENQGFQFARSPRVAATYNPGGELDLGNLLGHYHEFTLRRIHNLQHCVGAISTATLHREIRGAVPAHLVPNMGR